jgi:hypothetical protein
LLSDPIVKNILIEFNQIVNIEGKRQKMLLIFDSLPRNLEIYVILCIFFVSPSVVVNTDFLVSIFVDFVKL